MDETGGNQRLCERCCTAGVRIALAGSLRLRHLLQLTHCTPTWFAVRGAVCESNKRDGEGHFLKVRDLAGGFTLAAEGRQSRKLMAVTFKGQPAFSIKALEKRIDETLAAAAFQSESGGKSHDLSKTRSEMPATIATRAVKESLVASLMNAASDPRVFHHQSQMKIRPALVSCLDST